MRSGADSEMTSGLAGPEVDIIKQAPGLRRDGQAALASAELYVIIDMPKNRTNTPANVPMRGVEPQAPGGARRVLDRRGPDVPVRHQRGRRRPRRHGQFPGLTLGSTIHSGQNTWQVVGMFETDGGIAETEIWCDARVLQGAYRRGNIVSRRCWRASTRADSFDTFRDWLTATRRSTCRCGARPSTTRSSRGRSARLIRTVGFGIAALMGIGAVFGAILTMYTAVSTRSREIATLRALGFNTTSVVVSVLTESLALGAIGGASAASLAYVAFNGYQTSTMNFQTFSQVAFAFQVTPQLLVMGLIYALVMGLIGGLFPAVRAARLPIPAALREL